MKKREANGEEIKKLANEFAKYYDNQHKIKSYCGLAFVILIGLSVPPMLYDAITG